MTDGAELLPLARELALEAGELIERMRDGVDLAGETKSSVADVVTDADRAADQLIVDGVLRHRPDEAILGEEGSGRDGSTGIRWIIDPIDGTTNYVYDIGAYSVSIAVEIDGELVAGVVNEPRGERCYTAVAGGGAEKNGHPITVSQVDDLAVSLVATGFGYLPERRAGQAEVLTTVLPRIRDIRRFGSAALDLCLVAEGVVDAYYEKGLNPWDLAAGTVIAREAGATVGNLRGGPPDADLTLAANPRLFDTLGDLLRSVEADRRP